MKSIENRCCGCAVPGYPCSGPTCSLRHVEVHYCDRCGCELEGYFKEIDGEELCSDCAEEVEEEEEEEE